MNFGSPLALTATMILLDTTVFGVAQSALLVRKHCTVSPFVHVLLVYIGLLLPVFTPFFFHWYAGALPPLLTVALNSTCVLAVTGPTGLAVMLIAGTTPVVTVTAILELPVQPDAFVTMTEYVPAIFTVIEELVDPVFQRYALPAEAVSTTDDPLQMVVGPEAEIETGTGAGCITVFEDVAVQPPEEVTVTV